MASTLCLPFSPSSPALGSDSLVLPSLSGPDPTFRLNPRGLCSAPGLPSLLHKPSFLPLPLTDSLPAVPRAVPGRVCKAGRTLTMRTRKTFEKRQHFRRWIRAYVTCVHTPMYTEDCVDPLAPNTRHRQRNCRRDRFSLLGGRVKAVKIGKNFFVN